MSKETVTPETIIFSNGKSIGPNEPCFIIAEMGQNHQGDIHLAKAMILMAKNAGADCVKFQKSHLEEKFTQTALDRPYNNPNSWGQTYGEHKRHLEFSEKQYMELHQFAKEQDILFTASAMDPVSLKFLHSLDVPFIKIGSGDADNIFMIEEAAKLKQPLVISTGMQDMNCVDKIFETVSSFHYQFTLLHCVSSYPTPPEDANLKCITTFKERFPKVNIGYSGHELGFNLTLAAVALGAKVVERHFTLDKTWRGSDHSCSLEPNELKQMIKSIREIESALGTGLKEKMPSEISCYDKLGKTIVSACNIRKGTVLTKEHIKVKVSKDKGITPLQCQKIVGLKINCDITSDVPILESFLNQGIKNVFFS